MTGLSMVALVLVVKSKDIGFAVAGPLLLAGIGGGAVVSPNTTLALECVPTRMAGAAGGALQTGQRIGTAVLTTVFRLLTSTTKGNYPYAAAIAISCAVGFMVLASILAILELRARRSESHHQHSMSPVDR